MSRNSILLLILAVAVAIRVSVAFGLHQHLARSSQQFLIAGDAAGYWELGKQLATKGELSIYRPPRRVLRMPGLPAFLALSIRLGGESLLTARVLLATVGAIACACVYWLGRELFDSNTGLIAAGLVACWPTMVGFSPVILSETLFAACLTASLAAAARLAVSDASKNSPMKRAAYAFGVGLLIAVATYVRPSWILVGPILAVGLVVTSRNRMRASFEGMFILIGLCIALFPWAVRNYLVTGHFVATTLWVGPSLYDGLNPDATGDSDMRFFERDGMAHWMSEYEIDRHYRSEAWQFVRSHPNRTLWLAWQKCLRYWKPWPNAAQFRDWRLCVVVSIPFVFMLITAAIGCWTVRRNVWAWGLTVGPIVYFAVIHMVFVASLRYRLPAEYPLCIMSAVGLQHICGHRQRKL